MIRMDADYSVENLVVEFEKFEDTRGTLTIAQILEHSKLPFKVQRVFWITGVPEKAHRGMHAHKTCWEALIAVNGRITIRMDNGKGLQETVVLDNPQKAILIPPMMWCELSDFSEQAVCLCLASGDYDKEGYISDYADFLGNL